MSRELLAHGRPVPLAGRRRPGDVVLDLVDAVVETGGVVVLDGVDLAVRAGEVVGLLGSPPAAPSALIGVLAGELRPRRGRVRHAGEDVSREPGWRRAELGIVHTLGAGRLVAGSVRDNVRLALQSQLAYPAVLGMLGTPGSVRAETTLTARVDAALARLGLAELAATDVNRLAWAARRRVEVAVALANDPDVLLVEDAGRGLDAAELLALAPLIRDWCRDRLLGVVVADSFAPFVLDVADRVVCLAGGRVVAHGRPADVRRSPEVATMFLGRPMPEA